MQRDESYGVAWAAGFGLGRIEGVKENADSGFVVFNQQKIVETMGFATKRSDFVGGFWCNLQTMLLL